ncbi:UNVERIFIED_CONTAM: Exocyst complex component 6 [Gekko kuhli]
MYFSTTSDDYIRMLSCITSMTLLSALGWSDSVIQMFNDCRVATDDVIVNTFLKLLDLFMVWDWSTYLADYGQPASKYLRVNPSTALALLEKMKDLSKKNNIFAQFRKNDRDKQKLIETVVRQLRGLVNGMAHQHP